MYRTPTRPPSSKNMVLTRKGTKQEQLVSEQIVNSEIVNTPGSRNSIKPEPQRKPAPPCQWASQRVEPLQRDPHKPRKCTSLPQETCRDNGSRTSTSTSVRAQRKRLELEAAQRKAKIQMDLIDKRLEADLADLEGYSPQEGNSEKYSRTNVEEWLEHSSQHKMDHREEVPQQGAIEMLATALKQITTTSASNGPNPYLLSRMSVPKDLPEFNGDPLEWLSFKQAYNESTQICGFSERENVWRLRKCLRGPAKDAVAALLICATSPDQLMATLELRFGNPDYIIHKITQDLQKLQPLPLDYQCEIVPFSIKIQNYVTAVRTVGRTEYLRGVQLANMILAKLPTVLISRWADYSFPKLQDETHKSRIDLISEFLHEEAIKISTTANIMATRSYSVNKYKLHDSSNTKNAFHTVLVKTSDESNENCAYCNKGQHLLTKCKLFCKALRKNRWRHVKKYGLCFQCLLSRHGRDTCDAPVCDKDECGGAHHRLLHNPPRNGDGGRDAAAQEPQELVSPTETVCVSVNDRKVLLKVVPVQVHGPKGVISASALLDDGSTVSLISAGLAARAGLRGRAEALRVRGAWDNETVVCESTVLTLNLSSMHNSNELFTISARSVNELNLPVQNVSLSKCNEYNHLKNVDIPCNNIYKPEILLGQDNFHLLVPLEVCTGKINEPSATRTPLGWCVHGVVRMPHTIPASPYLSLLIAPAASAADRALRDLHEEVRRSFSIDAMGTSGNLRQNKDEVRAAAMLENDAQLIDGRWHVGLPWKDSNCKLPNSYPNALSRLRSVERKMSVSNEYSSKYKDRVKHLLDNDFAKELENTERSYKTWYLPHFGVNNPNKKNLRLVFDAAAQVYGKSLNDYLLTGPDLLNSLLGIMLRFRENIIGVTGDIKDMFLRIKIKPEDQDALRFLWRDQPANDVKTYAMTSLIFGANCSPFIAQFIKNKNALRYESSRPAAVAAICKQHYMDDYIDSLPDAATAVNMIREISEIHKEGGFEIRNWTSNSLTVLDSLPKEALGEAAVKFKIDQQYQGERTLGMIWYPAQDEIGFDVSMKRIPDSILQGKQRPTKRLMLAVVMSIFDIFGFLTPFTIQGKIMLQDTWKENIGWDETISDDIYRKWRNWIELLEDIPSVRIPRCYLSTGVNKYKTESMPATGASETDSATTSHLLRQPAPPAPLAPRSTLTAMTPVKSATDFATIDTSGRNYSNLHVFCDASSKAMCAVAYWRWENNNIIYVAFIAGKGRVAPVKPTTIPRLELQAALLAARLANTVTQEHKLKTDERYFWCDSTTVLQWIYNDARNYKTFIANRLGEIDELTRACEWRYVPTKLNIADVGTREDYDVSVFRNDWLKGPSFLYEKELTWPRHEVSYNSNEDLERLNIIQNETKNLPVPDASRFSSWLRLLRATAAVLKFINKCRKASSMNTLTDMEQAERLLIKQAQMDSFAVEISAIKKGKNIERCSRLLTLSPILDEHGVLRCGGRIDAATGVSPETKRPMILDGKHHVARLLVKYQHEKAAHGNQETIVNNLKQRFWLIKLRPTVKYVAARCMLCRIRKAKPKVPRMGDLPEARMAHHQRPFTHCGTDLFGPMYVVVGRRQEKRYGVIFTCLTVRAVHLEIVHSITTDSMIMALRRMAARRGWPRHLMSDNGTNLRGADTELKRAVKELNEETLQIEAAKNSTEWTFIPPASPHWGGAWERLIRSVKTSLKVILKERTPRDEVLSTLMTEVENIVNSRPLTHVSVEPGSDETLTPNHFLLGASSNLPIPGQFDDSDLRLRKQWRKSQRLADMFWRRWVNEILPDLVPRRKWNQEQQSLKAFKLFKRSRSRKNPRNRVSPALVRSPSYSGTVDARSEIDLQRFCACRASMPPIKIPQEPSENTSYYSSYNSYSSRNESEDSNFDGARSDSAYDSARSSPSNHRAPVCYATVTYFNVNDSEDSSSIRTEYTLLDYDADEERDEDESTQNMINESLELVSTL